jgi:hypothetical protein
MFNIASSWAFFVSTVTTSSSVFLITRFAASTSQGSSVGHLITALDLGTVWLSAILLYLLLRIPRLRWFFKTNRLILTLFGIGNFILALVSISSAIAVSGIGGNISVAIALALITFGGLLTGPCWLALVGGNIWLLVRSLSPSETVGSTVSSIGPPSKAGLIVALVMLVPPFASFGWLYQSTSFELKRLSRERQAMATGFDELCKSIRIDFYKRPLDPRSAYFPQNSDLSLDLLDYVDFTEVKRPWLSKKGEAAYTRYAKVEGQNTFVNGKMNAVQIAVQEPEAVIEISTKAITGAEDRKKGFNIEETSIVDRRTVT